MSVPNVVAELERDLRRICGSRLQSLVMYGHLDTQPRTSALHDRARSRHDAIHTLAVVDGLSLVDLNACAALMSAWHERGLATPLVIATHELERSLDAFPFEFDGIVATHTLVAGANPFERLSVDAADIRRACEVRARSHLLHLREGCLETGGRADALSLLIVASAPAFASLVTSLARLERAKHHDATGSARAAEQMVGAAPGAIANIVALVGAHEISSARAEDLFPPYLDAVEKIVTYVDTWRR